MQCCMASVFWGQPYEFSLGVMAAVTLVGGEARSPLESVALPQSLLWDCHHAGRRVIAGLFYTRGHEKSRGLHFLASNC